MSHTALTFLPPISGVSHLPPTSLNPKAFAIQCLRGYSRLPFMPAALPWAEPPYLSLLPR